MDALFVLTFERSCEAEIAGHCQWSLNAADHHRWNPYEGIPQEWNHQDREEPERELWYGVFIFISMPSQYWIIFIWQKATELSYIDTEFDMFKKIVLRKGSYYSWIIDDSEESNSTMDIWNPYLKGRLPIT